MNQNHIHTELARNQHIFKQLLSNLSEEEYLFRPAPGKWCLLEIICHLYDEERLDFRARVKHCLVSPEKPLRKIDPPGWVTKHDYLGQSFEKMLAAFLRERKKSLRWLASLESANWDSAIEHPRLGRMTAGKFLANWLEHDYLHIRQILGVKHHYLKQTSGEDLTYAGEW